jgi:integrase
VDQDPGLSALAGIAFRDEMGARFDFHSLRVQCATDLIRSGVDDPFVVQERMRHSDIKTTLDHYEKMGATPKQRAALAATPRRTIKTA